ncbi:hypothetical protein [Paenibacillus silvae]|uniref:hypothetical protein n=1 Tax=Paenibacillus silvae TaxID=1325358 RepID=UPI00142DB90B|nr:hypothetical protein [Paenibacillus silvae]
MRTLQQVIHVLQHSSDENVMEQFFEHESLIWIVWRETKGTSSNALTINCRNRIGSRAR